MNMGRSNMAAGNLPNPEEMRKRLRYDPETGILHWKSGYRLGQQAFTYVNKLGYPASNFNGRVVLAHRAAWAVYYGEWPEVIDHINGDKQDNRIANLRNVTQSENARNRSMDKRNKSGHMGVYFDKARGKFAAYISANGKRVSLGRFANIEDAQAAREAALVSTGYPPAHGRPKTTRSA